MPCAEKNNEVTEYEEVWRPLSPTTGPKRAWILQSGDGKIFLGRIGGSFMALSEGKAGFGARKEEWDSSEGKWSVKYEIGDVEGVSSFAGVGSEEFDGEKDWKEGENVVVLGKEYVVRALEAL
jgi:hypothetical protein